MRSPRSIFALLATFLTFQSTIASPFAEAAINERALVKRYSGTPSGPKEGYDGPDATDYPNDDAIRAAFTSPKGPYVFFSQLPDSDAAFNFAQSKGGVIFRQAFPKKYTVHNGRSEKWYQNFADRFSGVFAEKASGDVYVVSNWAYKIDDCRVWSRIEFPTLKNNADVESVILVDYSNPANQKVIWSGNDGAPFKRSNTLEKRGEGTCLDWDGYGDDPADPDAEPTLDIGYYPGNCGVHIVQYQKNEGKPASSGGTSDYRFDITLVDDQGENIGGMTAADGPTGVTINVDSKLPEVFELTAGAVDSDPISFAYNGETWNSASGQCKFGKYDSGSRQGDCGFTC